MPGGVAGWRWLTFRFRKCSFRALPLYVRPVLFVVCTAFLLLSSLSPYLQCIGSHTPHFVVRVAANTAAARQEGLHCAHSLPSGCLYCRGGYYTKP